MSRDIAGFELGFNLFEENGDSPISTLRGSGAPGADGSFQDNANPGSFYHNSAGEVYVKKSAGAGTDKWSKLSDADDLLNLSWRGEVVRALTDDTVAAGSVDPTSWSDNETPVAAGDFTVGEFVIGDADGTPALFEVTAISAPNITLAAAADPLANNDAFIVRNYLPDSPASQENDALVVYNGSVMIKLADVDWNFADGINIAAGYAASAGDVSSSDTVQGALQKLDGNLDNTSSILGRNVQSDSDMGNYTGSLLNDGESIKQNIQQLETEAQALRTSLGGVAGDVDMGVYTGNIISDNVNQRTVNQELESAIEALESTAGPADIAQNTPTVVDTVLVDEFQSAEWEVTAHDIGDPTKVRKFRIEGFHNGHAGADATVVKDDISRRQNIGGTFNIQASVVLSGTGASQTMGLQLDTSDADGIRYTVRRTGVAAL